jgi:hypothetical protein
MQQTTEERRAAYSTAMAGKLGSLFSALWDEVVRLHVHWGQFVELFGGISGRIEIMNRTAPRFFVLTERLLWNEALLSISRLTAHHKSAGKPILTVRRLPELIEDAQLRSAVEKKISALVVKAAAANTWRNRRIAHTDLLLALDRPTEPLPVVTREAIEEWLAALADVMNTVELPYTNGTTAYSHSISTHGARELLFWLRDGLRREEDRRKAMDAGKYDARLFNDDLGAV